MLVGVTEQLVDCSGGDEISEESGQKRKLAALLSLIQHHKVHRTIVFCNKISTCRKVCGLNQCCEMVSCVYLLIVWLHMYGCMATELQMLCSH